MPPPAARAKSPWNCRRSNRRTPQQRRRAAAKTSNCWRCSRPAQQDPRQLIATPSSLLKSQPAISRLKDALVDAQVRTANLLGTYADEHPFVIAAREAETLIQKQLHDEVAVAIKGLEIDLSLNGDREASLEREVGRRPRAAGPAGRGSRAEYANLVAAVENHTKLVEAARKNLADARAEHAECPSRRASSAASTASKPACGRSDRDARRSPPPAASPV